MGRLVSLLPSATDLIFELGLGEQLLGVSHCCDHPGAASLPVLTRSIIGSDLPQAEIDRAVSEAVRAGRAGDPAASSTARGGTDAERAA